jgi:IMP dehydrogenase
MKCLTFSDVLISPQYSDIKSRKEVDLTSDFGAFNISLPICSANMKSITGVEMAKAMSLDGGLGILHRFNDIPTAVSEFKESLGLANNKNIGVSIGVQNSDKERFSALYENGARIFTIDVAHGHSILVKEMIQWIKSQNLKDVYIIAGNIATGEGAIALSDWGANAVKVGIGPGAACTTRKNTGVGVPQLFALKNVRDAIGSKFPIIADGGITTVGCIAKALKYSNAVMLGSFISGTTETPGKVFRDERDQYYKVYSGSASGENKDGNGQPTDFIEGISTKVPFRGHVKYILKEIRDGLRSAFSYVGARTLEEFQENCYFIEISSGGKAESKL